MKISILGLGAYGIALAKVFHENNNKVSIWTKFEDEAKNVLLKRENTSLLPGVKIPKGVEITTDLNKCMNDANIIVIAVPANVVRSVSKELAPLLQKDQVICIVSKGIENASNKLMNDVVYEETKSENICVLSGPSFALELANGSETGFVIASKSQNAIMNVKMCIENSKIVVSETSDVIGVQVCASVKNVFAILLGMLDSMDKSDSCISSVLTCILNDLRLIVEVLGGNVHTVFSYAGVGDLLLTCMSSKSRNYTLGKHLGRDLDVKTALLNMKTTTVEGLYTLDSVIKLLEERQVTIKSLEYLYNVIHRNQRVEDILRYIKY